MQKIIFKSLIAALVLLAGPSFSQERLQPDFTFKRVTVPASGSGRRITVQIDPSSQSQEAVQPQSVAALPIPREPLPMAWFWKDIKPELAASGPGRLELALQALRAAPDNSGIAAPRLRTLQGIAARHGADILRHTVGTNVSPALVVAVIAVESGGRADAVSSAGAAGLMQLMPATAERFGVADRTLPGENIHGGVAYLSWLMDHFGNDPILALAGYNAGEGSIRDAEGVPPYAETRAYVPKVLAAWNVARALCRTPPELMSDGCVFQMQR